MHKVKVQMKSLPYDGKEGRYEAGSTQILDFGEAHALADAGIAIVIEDPYVRVVAGAAVVEEEPKAEEPKVDPLVSLPGSEEGSSVDPAQE